MQLIGRVIGSIASRRSACLVNIKKHFVVGISSALFACAGTTVAQPSISDIRTSNSIEPLSALISVGSSRIQSLPGPQFWRIHSVSDSESFALSTKSIAGSAITLARATASESISLDRFSSMAAFEIAPKRCQDRRLIQWPAGGAWGDFALIQNAVTAGDWGAVLTLSIEQLMVLPQHSRTMVKKTNEYLSVQLQGLFNYQRRVLSFIWP